MKIDISDILLTICIVLTGVDSILSKLELQQYERLIEEQAYTIEMLKGADDEDICR